MVNIRAKGQNGEREVQAMLNEIVQDVRAQHGFPLYEDRDLPFQRNQNQSAVGGDDLTNPFQLAIEVKRQEALSVNTWWKQCVASSLRSNGRAILIYRQSRKPWRVVMTGLIHFTPDASKYLGPAPVEINIEVFKLWFAEYYRSLLLSS
jgi:hypothetical protein